MPETINVLFLAAEAAPFVKIGGLADVAGSLPLALRSLSQKNGAPLDVRLVLPLHRVIRDKISGLRRVAEFSVFGHGRDIPAQVFETSLDGMPVYFIDGEPISAAESVYTADPAADRDKFVFFSLAALELPRHLGWRIDLLHVNDWHTALAPYALRTRWPRQVSAHPRSVLTIHNLAYMGGDGADVLSAYGLPPLDNAALPGWALTQPLPLGLWAAEAVIPVSPTYAGEILTPEFGYGLETFLSSRADSITGILNGIDLAAWNPATDEALAANFNAEDLSARSENKLALQKKLGLKEDIGIPLLAMVGRIDQQKGVDIALEALPRLGEQPWQFVLLGTGDPHIERAAADLQAAYPDRSRAILRFDAPLSHLIYAGADLFLMPSRFEPCGLAQMIAMRYGCIPVVRATGGLVDTVRQGQTGFLFEGAEAESMANALESALSVYHTNPEKWQRLQRNGMKKDFSWARSARRYAQVYRSLVSGDEP